jgi:hypothetical protein
MLNGTERGRSCALVGIAAIEGNVESPRLHRSGKSEDSKSCYKRVFHDHRARFCQRRVFHSTFSRHEPDYHLGLGLRNAGGDPDSNLFRPLAE